MEEKTLRNYQEIMKVREMVDLIWQQKDEWVLKSDIEELIALE